MKSICAFIVLALASCSRNDIPPPTLANAGHASSQVPSPPIAVSGAGSSIASATASPASSRKLTRHDLDDAYAAVNVRDPRDKQIATATSRLGPPGRVTPQASYWYGISDSGSCFSLVITADQVNVSSDMPDRCGLP